MTFFLIAIPTVVISVINSIIAGDTFLLIASSTDAGSLQEKRLLSFPSTPYLVLLVNLTAIVAFLLVILINPITIKGFTVLYLSNLQLPDILTVGAVYLSWILHIISALSYSLYYTNLYA